MSDFVLDASLSLAWCFEDETTDFTDHVLDRIRAGDQPVAPALWLLEVANGIRNAERRNRITRAQADQLLILLYDLPVRTVTHSAEDVFQYIAVLARKHNLSSYDAAYLYLAQQENLPLATLDGPLRKAAAEAGWPVIAP